MTLDAGNESLTVMLREDKEGRPEGKVLAQVKVPSEAFERTPRYSWVEVRLPQPVAVRKGETYWIYIPLGGRYHWALCGGHVYKAGRAFSDKFGYTNYDWIFEVYIK